MQFKGKLINQTWENGKKSNFEPDFGLFDSNLGPQIFYGKFHLCWYLDIVPKYHPMQFKQKLMNQTWENGKKKLILGLILARVGPNLVSKNFFSRFYFYLMLNIVEMNQTWKNGKKPGFQPDFGPIGPNLGPNNFSWILPQLDVRHCKLSLYSISRKTNEPNFRKRQKKLILGLILARFGPNLDPKYFLMLCFVVSYHWMQFQGKLMNKTWENCKKPSARMDIGHLRPNLEWNQMKFLNHALSKTSCLQLWSSYIETF